MNKTKRRLLPAIPTEGRQRRRLIPLTCEVILVILWRVTLCLSDLRRLVLVPSTNFFPQTENTQHPEHGTEWSGVKLKIRNVTKSQVRRKIFWILSSHKDSIEKSVHLVQNVLSNIENTLDPLDDQPDTIKLFSTLEKSMMDLVNQVRLIQIFLSFPSF
jgi:hypothetical protein